MMLLEAAVGSISQQQGEFGTIVGAGELLRAHDDANPLQKTVPFTRY